MLNAINNTHKHTQRRQKKVLFKILFHFVYNFTTFGCFDVFPECLKDFQDAKQ